MLKFNSMWRDIAGDYVVTFQKALEGVETLAGICLKAPLYIFESVTCQATLPVLCSCEFREALDENTRLVSFIASPLIIKAQAERAAHYFSRATLAADRVARVYYVAKGVLMVSYLGAMGWVVDKGLVILSAKITLLAKLPLSGVRLGLGFATKLYALSAIALPVVHLTEVMQTYKLERGEAIDPDLKQDCFGKDVAVLDEAALSHLRKFRRMKMILTANAVVELVAKQLLWFPPLVPVSYIALAGTTVVKIGFSFYWSSQVKRFTKADTSWTPQSIAINATALVTFASLPFLTLSGTAPYALGVMAVSTLAHLYLKRRNSVVLA